MIRFLISAFAVLTLSLPASAQESRAWKRDAAIILFSGVGGGILGLSTLAFYGQPQEHTSNVSAGAFIGVIAGVSYVVWARSRDAAPPPNWMIVPRGEGADVAYRFDF